MAYPGNGEHSFNGPSINISRLFEHEFTQVYDQLQQKINLAKREDLTAPTDILGFLGRSKWIRDKIKQEPISKEHFLRVVAGDNDKIKRAFLYLRQIDNEGIGTVTKNELEDIFKTVYPSQLNDKNIVPLFEEFQTVSNHLLIDMRKFKQWVMDYIRVQKVKSYPKLTQEDIEFLNNKLAHDSFGADISGRRRTDLSKVSRNSLLNRVLSRREQLSHRTQNV